MSCIRAVFEEKGGRGWFWAWTNIRTDSVSAIMLYSLPEDAWRSTCLKVHFFKWLQKSLKQNLFSLSSCRSCWLEVVMTCVKLVKAILVGFLHLAQNWFNINWFTFLRVILPNRRTKRTMALEMIAYYSLNKIQLEGARHVCHPRPHCNMVSCATRLILPLLLMFMFIAIFVRINFLNIFFSYSFLVSTISTNSASPRRGRLY